MKIYDCFLYNGEQDLAEIRFHELDSRVDYFVIVESNTTFSGKTKKYLFNTDNFQKFKHKIRYYPVTDGKADYSKKDYWTYFSYEQMYREFYLRNSIALGLSDAEPNDIVLLSDVDEIPALSDMDLSNDLFIFKQDCMQLKLNLLNPGLNPFYGSKGVRYQYLGWPAEFRIHDRPHIKMNLYKDLKKQIIQRGGWHFSYCSSVQDILYKVSSYAHNERAEFISPQHIDDCIINKKDIWGGRFNYALNTDRLLPYDVKNLPAYIQNNIDRFKDLLSL